MPMDSNNRTITQVAVTQGAAGQLDLVAAPGAGLRVYVTGLYLAATGVATVTFQEGTGPTALSGAIPLAAGLPINLLSGGTGDVVLATNTANSKLSITSATLPVFGWVRYFIDQ